MIELTRELPSSVIIAEAHGTVSADDYEKVLIPAVDAAAGSGERLRLLYVLSDDFEGFALEAALDDAKLGVHHWRDFERIGLVTDHKSYRLMSNGVGLLMPGEVRVFPLTDLEAAKVWIQGE